MKIFAEKGNLIVVVFKAAPFGPGPDPSTGQISMQMNFFKGVFMGYKDMQVILESPGAERNVRWYIDDADILMWADEGKLEVALSVKDN
jgi:hypothetical protein